jgi:hypothetical protein
VPIEIEVDRGALLISETLRIREPRDGLCDYTILFQDVILQGKNPVCTAVTQTLE